MVAVSMGVRDYQRHRLALVSPEPGVNHNTYVTAYFGLARASVEQKRLILAEEQVEKWLLIVGAARLAYYIEVLVVLVNLELRYFYAFGSAKQPGTWQYTSPDSCPIGLRRLRITT